MDGNFPIVPERVMAGYQWDFCDTEHAEYDEKTFKGILTLERKRTERSKRPFMLLLVTVSRMMASERGPEKCRLVVGCMGHSIRDIDVLGWYEKDRVLGVIFTEIGNSRKASDAILERVKNNLGNTIGVDGMRLIEISVHLFPEKYGSFDSPIDLTLYPDIKGHRASHRGALFVKRIIDIVGSLVALIVFSPLFLVIASTIKATSKGPVLFKQQRLGQYGKAFTFLKFRSMYANNDPTIHREYVEKLIKAAGVENGNSNGNSGGDKVYKIRNDPRITRIGRFLRRTSLDEFPQFFNVLKGDLSLVGPRPPIPYEMENYEAWHRRRIFDMKPGLTGIWQVEGRSRTTFNEMVRLDLYYMRHWSLWLDIKLLCQTPWVMLTNKGAY